MDDLQTAYQQALSGKPSQHPLIEMVLIYLFESFREQISPILGHSFITRSNHCTEKWSCSITIHSIYSLSFTQR